MPAGGGEWHGRHLHPRSLDVPALNGVPQRDVHELGRAHVSHGGEAGVERAFRVRGCSDRDVDRRPAEQALVVVRLLAGQVGVNVDEARQQRRWAEVHDGVPVGDRELRAHLHDRVRVDEHDGVVDPSALAPRVYEVRCLDRDANRRRLARSRCRTLRDERPCSREEGDESRDSHAGILPMEALFGQQVRSTIA